MINNRRRSILVNTANSNVNATQNEVEVDSVVMPSYVEVVKQVPRVSFKLKNTCQSMNDTGYLDISFIDGSFDSIEGEDDTITARDDAVQFEGGLCQQQRIVVDLDTIVPIVNVNEPKRLICKIDRLKKGFTERFRNFLRRSSECDAATSTEQTFLSSNETKSYSSNDVNMKSVCIEMARTKSEDAYSNYSEQKSKRDSVVTTRMSKSLSIVSFLRKTKIISSISNRYNIKLFQTIITFTLAFFFVYFVFLLIMPYSNIL